MSISSNMKRDQNEADCCDTDSRISSSQHFRVHFGVDAEPSTAARKTLTSSRRSRRSTRACTRSVECAPVPCRDRDFRRQDSIASIDSIPKPPVRRRSNKVIMLSRSTARSSTRSIVVEYDNDDNHDSNKTSNNNNENINCYNRDNSMSSFGDSSSKLPFRNIIKLKSHESCSSHGSRSSRTSISSMASSLHYSKINDKYVSFSLLLDNDDINAQKIIKDGHLYSNWQQRLVPLLFTMCLLGWTGFFYVILRQQHILQQFQQQSDVNNVSSDARRFDYPTLDDSTATSTTTPQLRSRRHYDRKPKQRHQRVVESSSSLSSSRREDDSNNHKLADVTMDLGNRFSWTKETTTTIASQQNDTEEDSTH
jgi:hypothetical protein